ncbi:MAG TPA: PDGLE domain-containing protein [Chroococcidiopsis sp.]
MRNKIFIASGLGIALAIAALLSPFASSKPDGLNRVSEDLEFAHKASANAPAEQLPFASMFKGYAVKGVPEQVATPIAGIVGTLLTFGLAWGSGRLLIRRNGSAPTESRTPD